MNGKAGDVVLVGGGHSHVQVMTALRDRPEPGLRLVLVSDRLDSPYSGMLPGHIAGLYRRDEMHIDLAGLAAATGTRLIHARATGIDMRRRLVICEGREPVPYALASLNVGIGPDLSGIAGAQAHGIAVKPISTFLDRCDALLSACPAPDGQRDIAIVGNGAAGAELALALAARLGHGGVGHGGGGHGGDGGPPDRCTITLIGSGRVVPRLNARGRALVEQALDRRGIVRLDGVRVAAIEPGVVIAEDGRRIAAGTTLISTRARAPHWLAATGLPLSSDGSVSTMATLQVCGHPDIFAVGDCAEIIGSRREKAGVFAVRQGPVLAQNIRARWRGSALKHHRPQRDYLVLISTGDGRAIAARGRWLACEGALAWRLKDWIDRRFMARFTTAGSR